jgi:hypothetical protein
MLTGGTEGTLKIGRKMLPPEGSHVCSSLLQGSTHQKGRCYTPRNEVVGGYTSFTMSVRPSVDKSYVV